MSRTRTLLLSVGLLALLAAATPLTATAVLPKPKKAEIVPFEGMDGVAIGTSKSKALNKWGDGDGCIVGTGGRETCSWFADSSTEFPVESASLEVSGGKVCGMLIRGGTSFDSGELSITRLKKWRTEEGVGLGSKLSAAKKVMGKLVDDKHGVTTAFTPGTTDESKKQVEGITIFKKNCPVT